jgi:hypothetical protein
MKALVLTSLILLLCLCSSIPAFAVDPVADCRKAHADNPTAHIACLEAALNAAGSATPQPTTPVAPQAAESSSVFGSEQVQQQKRASGETDEEQVTVRIVALRYNSGGLGVFKFDNGQIWRETEEVREHQRLDPGQSYQATIERGTLGGYRMFVEGSRRMLKIERLK